MSVFNDQYAQLSLHGRWCFPDRLVATLCGGFIERDLHRKISVVFIERGQPGSQWRVKAQVGYYWKVVIPSCVANQFPWAKFLWVPPIKVDVKEWYDPLKTLYINYNLCKPLLQTPEFLHRGGVPITVAVLVWNLNLHKQEEASLGKVCFFSLMIPFDSLVIYL